MLMVRIILALVVIGESDMKHVSSTEAYSVHIQNNITKISILSKQFYCFLIYLHNNCDANMTCSSNNNNIGFIIAHGERKNTDPNSQDNRCESFMVLSIARWWWTQRKHWEKTHLANVFSAGTCFDSQYLLLSIYNIQYDRTKGQT